MQYLPHLKSKNYEKTFKKFTHQGLSNIKNFYMPLSSSNGIGVNTLLIFEIVVECNLKCFMHLKVQKACENFKMKIK